MARFLHSLAGETSADGPQAPDQDRPNYEGRPILRLVSLFALLCFLPLAFLSFFTIDLANKAVVREVNARVRTTSAVTAVLVQQQMEGVAELTASYAGRGLLINAMADGDPAKFDNPAIVGQISQLNGARPGIGGVFVTDTDCRLTQVIPVTPGLIGKDFSFRDWCTGVKATGQPYVSDAYKTAILGRPLVVAAAAIVMGNSGAQTGKPLGIIAVVYTLDAIRGFADQVARVQGIHLTITDKRGTLLVGDDRRAGPADLVSVAARPTVREALAGRSGVTRSTTTAGDTLSAFAPVRTVGWTITADVPARDALAGVGRLRSTVLSVAALLALVLLGGLGLLVRTLGQRRAAERALLEREAHTRAILDAATDAFMSMDGEGRIVAWNARAQEIFGWPEDEAVGRVLSDTILPPRQRGRHQGWLADFLATGIAPGLNQRFEITALHRDGREFPAEIAVWPVHTRDGWTFNAFAQDITERHRAQAELATARDQALEASQLKSEFLANMSHEIRTPMNGVLGMTSLLLDTDLRVDQREFAETVRTSGEALLEILNDILDFSKIEAGRLDLESIDFDLRGLVEDVAALLSFSAHDKDLELACSLPVNLPPTVRGDPTRLRQVLTNLVGNAVKFTPSGEVLVEMTMTVDGTPGDDATTLARFQVVDTGIGIAAGDQAAVFESFSQADAGTTRRYGGTGLGLAISRQLVELMGGQIGADSEPGRGSTFWFTIPLERGEALPGPAPRTDLSGLRVLIVDDNATNRTILTRFFHAWGIRSEEADGAAQALRAMATHAADGDPFDAAVLDLNMPDVDGIELARRIAADPRLPPVKLVLLTSSGQRGEAGLAREAGITGYLNKPVRQAQLFDCLATVMGMPSAASATEEHKVIRSRPVRQHATRDLLLAEDNLINQRVAVAMLDNLGFHVDVVANGAEAVEAAASKPYQAILLDCQMPVMDGYEASMQIRHMQEGARRVPIIAVTASAMKSDQERCLAAGMDDYLAKPLSLESLAAMLARWAPDESVDSDLPADPARPQPDAPLVAGR